MLSRLSVEAKEVIFVDDGSPDDAVDQLVRLKKSYEAGSAEMNSHFIHIRIIRLSENSGQQAAVYCGLSNANGDLILTMDDDLQHPPAYIPEFLEMSGEYDLSYALPRTDRRGQSLRIGSRMRDLFFRKILACPPQITPGSFRLISRRAVEYIKERDGGFVYVSALIFRHVPSLTVQNLYYDYPANESIRPFNTRGTQKVRKSRFTTGSRIRLYLKLILYYGLPVSLIHSRKKAYIIKDEL